MHAEFQGTQFLWHLKVLHAIYLFSKKITKDKKLSPENQKKNKEFTHFDNNNLYLKKKLNQYP
jgi:hypothetical protein